MRIRSRKTYLFVVALVALPVIIMLTVGCGPSGHHLSEDEWNQVVDMTSENTKAASELVERDADSRKQWLSLHEDLQSERSEIGRQRDLLEQDRRTWTERERRDAVIAAAITAFGLLAACSLPLILIAFLVWPRQPEDASDAVCEILVEDLVSESRRITDGGSDTQRIEDGR